MASLAALAGTRLFTSSPTILPLVGALVRSENYCDAILPYSYRNQDAWPGICVRGHNNLQSPINITSSDVKSDPSLVKLDFSNTWREKASGLLKNTGRSVQFVPNQEGSATIKHHRGVYLLQQFHFHWGPCTGAGSEHTIDDGQAEAEIHFVHVKKDTTDETRGDFLTVIGVLAEVQEGTAVSGPWAMMDVSSIQPNISKPVDVSGLVLEELLPKNRSYYYYQGSITTPPCSETVQWFIMKERVTIPSDFIKQLRMIQEETGQPLKSNCRSLQPIGSRVVTTPNA